MIYDKLMAKIRSFIKFIFVTSQIFYPFEILMVQHIPNTTYLLMLFSYLLWPSPPPQKNKRNLYLNMRTNMLATFYKVFWCFVTEVKIFGLKGI